jgi:hypothetical protein
MHPYLSSLNQHTIHYLVRYLLQCSVPGLHWVCSTVDPLGINIVFNLKKTSAIHWDHIVDLFNCNSTQIIDNTISSEMSTKALKMYYKNNGDKYDIARLNGDARGSHTVWVCDNFVFEAPSDVLPSPLSSVVLTVEKETIENGYHYITISTTINKSSQKQKKLSVVSNPETVQAYQERYIDILKDNNISYQKHMIDLPCDESSWQRYANEYPLASLIQSFDSSWMNLPYISKPDVCGMFVEALEQRECYHHDLDRLNPSVLRVSGWVADRSKVSQQYEKWLNIMKEVGDPSRFEFLQPHQGYHIKYPYEKSRLNGEVPNFQIVFYNNDSGAQWPIALWYVMPHYKKGYYVWYSPCLSLERNSILFRS